MKKKKNAARLKINVYARNLEPVPNKLHLKFFHLRAFVGLFVVFVGKDTIARLPRQCSHLRSLCYLSLML